jgi:tetratricopeptide (TPR) repeat protein
MDLSPIMLKSKRFDWIMAQRSIRSVLMIPGFLGGLLGVIIGMILTLVSLLGGSHGLAYSEGFLSPSIGGALYILLGLLGSIGSIMATKKRQAGGRILIACGLLGFLIGALSMSPLYWGWKSWAVSGVMLIFSGSIALAGDENIPQPRLLNSDNRAVRASIYFVIGLSSIAISIAAACLLISIHEDPEATIANTLYWAGVAESMGRYDIAIRNYDEVLSLDPSNEDATVGKANTLYRLGMSQNNSETLKAALETYNRAMELNSSSERAAYGRAEVLKALSSGKGSLGNVSPRT